MIKVKIYRDGEKQQEVELLRAMETIGRSRTCTLRLVDSSISGKHCEIQVDDEGAWLIDAGSTNGTLVNDHRVDKTLLKVGDKIRLGRLGLLVTRIEHKTGKAAVKVTKKKKKGRPLTVRKKAKAVS